MEFLRYWYEALNSPLGIWLRTPDAQRLKGLLYSARAQAKDPAIAHLRILSSPTNPHGELWITNSAEAA